MAPWQTLGSIQMIMVWSIQICNGCNRNCTEDTDAVYIFLRYYKYNNNVYRYYIGILYIRMDSLLSISWIVLPKWMFEASSTPTRPESENDKWVSYMFRCFFLPLRLVNSDVANWNNRAWFEKLQGLGPMKMVQDFRFKMMVQSGNRT